MVADTEITDAVLGGDLDRTEALQLVATRARELADADYAAVLLPSGSLASSTATCGRAGLTDHLDVVLGLEQFAQAPAYDPVPEILETFRSLRRICFQDPREDEAAPSD